MNNAIKKKPTPKIQQSEYEEAAESYMGWCIECAEFTRDETEPDAEGYDCPKCGSDNTVVGAEDALVAGLFEFA